jgi:hypothetical protein
MKLWQPNGAGKARTRACRVARLGRRWRASSVACLKNDSANKADALLRVRRGTSGSESAYVAACHETGLARCRPKPNKRKNGIRIGDWRGESPKVGFQTRHAGRAGVYIPTRLIRRTFSERATPDARERVPCYIRGNASQTRPCRMRGNVPRLFQNCLMKGFPVIDPVQSDRIPNTDVRRQSVLAKHGLYRAFVMMVSSD